MNVATENVRPAGTPSRAWLWVLAAFGLQLAVWTAWFVIAARHPVQEVPLAGAGRSSP